MKIARLPDNVPSGWRIEHTVLSKMKLNFSDLLLFIHQYRYVGSVLAFLNPGFPQVKSYSFKFLHTSGFAEFWTRHSLYLSNSAGHSFLTINMRGALGSSLGNLNMIKVVLDTLWGEKRTSLFSSSEHVRPALHFCWSKI